MVRWENISKYGMMRVEKIKRKLHGNTGSSIGLSRRAWRSIANRNHTGYPLRRRLLDDLSSKFRLEKLDHKIREHQIRVSGWNIVENIVVFPVKSQNVEKRIRTPLALYKEIY